MSINPQRQLDRLLQTRAAGQARNNTTQDPLDPGNAAILKGTEAANAAALGLYGLVRILTNDGTSAEVELFRPPAGTNTLLPEGQIGVAASTSVVPLGSLDPLPYLVGQPMSDMTLLENATNNACRGLDRDDLWGCASCDPTGAPFDANAWSQSLDSVLAEVTTFTGAAGTVAYFMFSCPSQIVGMGHALSHPDASCNSPLLAAVGKADGTNRYNIVAVQDELILKQTFLQSYGMPTTLEYFNGLPWSQIEQYKRMAANVLGQRVICDEVDTVWLRNAIENLLKRGFVLSKPAILGS